MNKLLQINTAKKGLIATLIAIAGVVLLNYATTNWVAQIDLTEDKRFTLTDATKRAISEVNTPITIVNYFEGDFPASFKRLQIATKEKINEFRGLNNEVSVELIDPNDGDKDAVNAIRKNLGQKGVFPTNIRVNENGEKIEKIIYPTLIVKSQHKEIVVKLLENEIAGASPDEVINNSVALLEYKLANAISKASQPEKPIVMFLEGHGELIPQQTKDIQEEIGQHYKVGRLNLNKTQAIDPRVSLLIVAKPQSAFSREDKIKIDQYVMNGGRTLWMIDKYAVDLDSLYQAGKWIPKEYPLNIEDILFRYGARIKNNLVLDLACSKIPLVTGMIGNAPQFEYPKWYYHLTSTPKSEHPIVKNLDRINLFYPSVLDTVKTKTPSKKTILLSSSDHVRTQSMPNELTFEILRYPPDVDQYNKKNLTLGALYEGQFSSLYENRLNPTELNSLKQPFKTESVPTKMIIISDGDIGKSISKTNQNGSYDLPLGFNEYDRYTYDNKEFLLNCIEYLMDDNGLIEARSKEVKLRLLDRVKAKKERTKWQVINLVTPLVIVVLFGFIWNYLRRRKYGV